MDFARFDALTFDVYGTLIDWETGIAAAVCGVAAELGSDPTDEQVAEFAGSAGDWPAFPDSAEALASLHERFRLGATGELHVRSSASTCRASGSCTSPRACSTTTCRPRRSA